MKSLILLLLTNYSLFAAYCPYGCLDSSTESIYTEQGQKNYDTNDEMMLNSFLDIANKMKDYYQDFENKSSKMIEDGAKVQYLENVTSSEVVLELTKGNQLKALEIDSKAVKTQQNNKSTIK